MVFHGQLAVCGCFGSPAIAVMHTGMLSAQMIKSDNALRYLSLSSTAAVMIIFETHAAMCGVSRLNRPATAIACKVDDFDRIGMEVSGTGRSRRQERAQSSMQVRENVSLVFLP
ncbi:hypothetical protein [Cohaesibacter sp. ES.047]|uniref:hypothetical protein n=1 Tax=Cohaesibacter sp. ES.047 TaxID=1798205 RepID=UPI0012FDBFDF|nr:hypothetical protein [Cohaesibacter sp. ES.047]